MHASGPFDVKVTPMPPEEATGAPAIGRMSIDKRFHGDLDATSKGEMIASQGHVTGSAGYVAMEIVTGALHGRSGTFVLQHTGVMDRGTPSLVITVVPDSGTGELTGLAGTMKIIIEGKAHSYEFDYTLPDAD
jgi:hypothetical protein